MRFLLVTIILNSAAILHALPVLEIPDYHKDINFTGHPVLMIQKGDSPEYKDPGYDDSDWRIVSPPASWKNIFPGYSGICWYRMHVKFPGQPPSHAVGIRLGVIVDVDEVFFNGHLIGSSGTFPPRRASCYDKDRLYEIPTPLIRPGGENVIAIRVAGLFGRHDGLTQGVYVLGDFGTLQQKILLFNFFEASLIIVYIIFALYFFTFFLKRPREVEHLMFAFFSLGTSTYTFMRTQFKYYLGADFFVMKKIEYLILSLQMILIIEFLIFFFKKKHRVHHYVYLVLTAVSFLLILFTSDYRFWNKVNYYMIQPGWLIAIPAGMYILISNAKKDRDARFMLVMVSILLAFFINDILVDRLVYNFMRMVNFGFFFFLVSLAMTLKNRFFRLHSEVEDLNVNLEKKVVERTEELEAAFTELKATNDYVTEINQRNEIELDLASRVQQGLVSPVVENRYWGVDVFMRPAHAVSGDFFDCYSFNEETIGIVVADVSGHGVSSALVTMIAKPIFFRHYRRHWDQSLEAIVRIANDALINAIGSIDNYLTALVVRLHPDRLCIVNAGHAEPLYKSIKDNSIVPIESSGMFLGMKGMQSDYKMNEFAVNPGDIVLLYTDALTESRNRENESFGIDRVMEVLRDNQKTPREIITALTDRLADFTGSSNLDDDCTIMVLQRRSNR